MQVRTPLLIVFLSVFSIACAQSKLDSLFSLVNSAADDTSKFSFYRKYINELTVTDPNKALTHIPVFRSLAGSDKSRLGQSFFLEGAAYDYMADYQTAIKKYFEAVRFYESDNFRGKQWRIALAYDYMGGAYASMKNYSEGVKYKLKAIAEYASCGDRYQAAITKFNLGNIYVQTGEYAKGVQMIDSSMKVFSEFGDFSSAATGNNTIGAVYFLNNQFNEALKYFKTSYAFHLKSGDKVSEVTCLLNIGETYNKLKNFDSALYYSNKAKELAEEANFKRELITIYENLSNIHENEKKYPEAIEDLKYSLYLRDTLYRAETQEQMQELSVKYNTEKREKQNQILNLELGKERNMKYFLGIASGLFLLTGFFIYRAYRSKKESNKELALKNAIIEEKNKLVESKNKDIHDSIHYAQRIQAAILPPDKLWFSILPDSFVLYKPKDILSGDFYWIEETPTHIFFAAADCTGHGVPGALMSIVNFNLLNKAVLEKSMTDPGKILDAVNNWLTESLHQTYQESAVRDGMDIALCTVDKASGRVFYACANNPVYVVNGDKLEILQGDNFPVGAYVEEMKRNFTTKEIPGGKDQHIYIFTDGYADQFGGPKGKKFKYKQLQEKITGMQQLTLQKQKHELSGIFDDWKGEFEQVDDVLIIGVKIV